ncbi:MAG: hypothetical protein JWR69_330 [Pedosphaera sp.]|nr:hypothetical protein [Pedosphaera sp.]
MAAGNIYLNIPGIKGESLTSGYQGQIAVSTFSEGINNTIAIGTGSGTGSGKAAFADITIAKNLDSASTPMYLTCAQGSPLQNPVVLTVTKTTGTGEVAYYTLTLSNVFIKSISTTTTAGEGATENLVLTCGSIQWSYTPFNSTGQPGTPIVHNWSVLSQTGS